MKKALMILFACACSAVFAGANNILVTFSTPGPDKYADGSTVLDGECYALVWTAADGTETNVLVAPIAKDGRCPPVLFQLDESKAGLYVNGAWSVRLLDTRDFAKDESGKTLAGVDESGAAKLVNTTATVADAFTAAGGAFNSASSETAVAAEAHDLSGVQKPQVKSITVVGANVFVTVGGMVPFLSYAAATGDAAGSLEVPEGAEKLSGKVSGDVTFVLPKKADGELIKITTVKADK